ncbi:hypothetical protein ABTB19_21020, partial [Acinetobacter baumannii]
QLDLPGVGHAVVLAWSVRATGRAEGWTRISGSRAGCCYSSAPVSARATGDAKKLTRQSAGSGAPGRWPQKNADQPLNAAPAPP